ncbi:MAG TPA: hypothetical protein GXZ95_05320 [Mollicutes bacterium]|nr:hypothetical protein [Mollicutes bacterium]
MKRFYEKIKLTIKENYKFIIFLISFYLILTIPLPYYIHTPGGLIDISDKVEIENEHQKKGSINLSYVTEMKGNVLTYLLSYVIPNWDLVDKGDYVLNNETYEDVIYRNKLLLEEANANATIVAYREAQKKIEIKEQHYYVVYIDEQADTTLQIGDELIDIEGTKVSSMKDYIDVVSKASIGDNLNITVIDKKGNKTKRTAKVFSYKNEKVTGIIAISKYDLETEPDIEFHFKETESGPSGGLMMTLAIYNKLIDEDLTKGFTIVGTGTIDVDGNVGEISGIEYKVKGAIKSKADIFLVPTGSNYEEAIKVAEKFNHKIKIIGVSTFYDALNYLREM